MRSLYRETFPLNNRVNGFRLTPTGLVNYWWGNDLYASTPNLAGAWHHVAATFDGATRRILVDGAVLAEDTPTLAGHLVSPASFSIGSLHGGEFFSGTMDEVRIWNADRSPAQIQEAMRRQLFGNETGLVGYWRFDEGSGLSTADATGNAANVATLVNGPAWVESTILPFAPTVQIESVVMQLPEVQFGGFGNGNDTASGMFYEWGPSLSYGNRIGPFRFLSGTGIVYWYAYARGLTPGATYQVRMFATNVYGTSYSTNISFVMSGPPTNIVLNTNDSGYGSLREVIRDLTPGDTVRFAPGVTGIIALTSGEIVITKSLGIEGPGAAILTVSGSQRSRVFRIDSGTVNLSGLTIAQGRVTGTNGTSRTCAACDGEPGEPAEGGAILNSYILTVSDCVFATNSVIGGRGGNGAADGMYSATGKGAVGGYAFGGAIANHGSLAMNVWFTTEIGFPHHLESKETLAPGPWTAFGPLALVGNGGVMSVSDTRPRATTSRFYRVVMNP